METEKKVKLIFVGILVVIALITGLKTWAIVREEILPDIRGEEAGPAIWNPYSNSWSFPAESSFDLDVQLTDVSIILRTHNAPEVSVVFEGERRQERQSRRTELVGNLQDALVRIYEEGSGGDLLGFTGGTADNGVYRGILTVSLPAQGAGYIALRTFSGDISIAEIKAAIMTLESTKGSLKAVAVTAAESLKLSSFEGNITLEGFGAGDCVVSASTGSTTVKTGTASTLYLEQYSNTLHLEDVTVPGKVTVTGSDSSVTLRRLEAGTLLAELSSGSMTLRDITVPGTVKLEVAGGSIAAENLQSQRLEMDSKNGSITCRDITTQLALCQSEGGNISLHVLSDCHITATSQSGSIGLELPPSMGFRLAVGTTSGQRDIAFQPGKYYLGSASADYYECQIGKGDWKVNVETVSGDISIQGS